MLIVGVLAATFLAAIITLRVALQNPSTLESQIAASAASVTAAAPVARRETRPTLDPAGFTGKAALAYQVAREIPHVLDQLQCYCACRSQYGHVSLLSCYVDGHGST